MASPNPSDVKGYNILCLDGGSLRGVSQLTILDTIMHNISYERGTKVHPTEFFDLVIGSGSGAVLAVLLVKFGMTINEAMKAYVDIIEQAFGHGDRGINANPRFDADILTKAIKGYCNQYFAGSNGDFKDESQNKNYKGCRLAVCALPAENLATPHLFRSYDIRGGLPSGPPAKVWDILHASMATPGFFPPITIGDRGMGQVYYNTGLRGNNPVQYAAREISSLFGPDAPISTIISIGSGHPETIRYRRDGNLEKVYKQIAADAEAPDQEMRRTMSGMKGAYYRFNVKQGFAFDWELEDEWKKHGEIITHTQAYTHLANVHRELNAATEAVMGRSVRCQAKRLVSAGGSHSEAGMRAQMSESYR